MLLPAPVELACPKGEQGPLCDRTAAVFDQVDRFGADAALVPAGLLLLCGKDAAQPVPEPVSHLRPAARRARHDPGRRRPHAPARALDPGRAEPRDAARAAPARDPALGLPLAGRVPARATPSQAGAGRRRPRHVPARRDASRHGQSRATCCGARGRPTRCASASSRSRRGSARRVRILLVSQMYPGPDAPELGTFVAELEQRARGARARARAGGRRPPRRPRAATRRSPGTSRSPRAGSARTSSTRTSSSRRAFSPCSPARAPARRHRARPGRRERGRARRSSARRRGSRSAGRRASSRSPTGCASRLESVAARGARKTSR